MKKIVLCILDGVGINKDSYGNAVKLASKPNFHNVFNKFPCSSLEASGIEVGLPKGQMGNSEVGHMNIGAGRTVYQLYEVINNDMKNDGVYNNVGLLKLIDHVKKNNSKIHLCGLLSDGGVHSDIKHLIKLIDVCKSNNVEPMIHVITDGRDVAVDTALKYINMIDELDYGKIVSLSGRFYAMDRNNNFDRVKLAYDCIVGNCEVSNLSIQEYIKQSYDNNEMDEYIKPGLFSDDYLKENDGFLFFNYRADRARHLMEVFTTDHNYFDTKKNNNVLYLGLTEYKDSFDFDVMYPNVKVCNSLGKVLSVNKVRQYRLAETEKYAHVTYYFDGGIEEDFDYCDKKLIPSKNSISYASVPEMSAYEINDDLIDKIKNNEYDFILVNFANGDMVGHTGDLEASVKTVEVLDECMKKLNDACIENNYLLIVTADHGNCEEMLTSDGKIITSHSTNKVMFMVNSNDYELYDGKLGDIAPSILSLMDIEIPADMTGNIIIKKK